MNANATTKDFQFEMEKASHTDLGYFFNQWLHRGGSIQLNATWKYDAIKKVLFINFQQNQNKDAMYSFPLDIGLYSKHDNSSVIKKLTIKNEVQILAIPMEQKPAKIELDPRSVLLGKFHGLFTLIRDCVLFVRGSSPTFQFLRGMNTVSKLEVSNQ